MHRSATNSVRFRLQRQAPTAPTTPGHRHSGNTIKQIMVGSPAGRAKSWSGDIADLADVIAQYLTKPSQHAYGGGVATSKVEPSRIKKHQARFCSIQKLQPNLSFKKKTV